MKQILSIIGLLLSFCVSSQTDYETYCFSDNNSTMMQVYGTNNSDTIKSQNGAMFPTKGTYRALNIAVNIIYDQTPAANPETNPNGAWGYTTNEGINNNPPNYLLNFFDVDNTLPYNGCVTRFYAESSFNQLILLSDYMIVNIKQSRITPNNFGGSFGKEELRNAVISYINQNNGLTTLYNHDTISEYDFTSTGSYGVKKTYLPDGKIDIINFLLRNTTEFHGGVKSGQGNSYVIPSVLLKINQNYYDYNTGTYQCVGSGDITVWTKNIFTHEYAHFFLGGNEFHTSGSVTTNDPYASTFMGIQRGYGLFGGGLLSCNGYERWRLGWYGNTNNAYPIAANNENSDITTFTGEKIFLLRDFVTYGDAIRIKLPYKDSESSSNQYIWLENHQSGKNGKFDEHIYNQPGTCRNVVQAGIYSYYQVGKDILESSIQSDIFTPYEKDNLRIISAEGNYDMQFIEKTNDCLGWCGNGVNCRPKYNYTLSNPLQGNNDQTEVFPVTTSSNQITYNYGQQLVGAKIKDGVLYNNLPYIGDNFDAFVPTTNGICLDISSNPSAINTSTYYTIQNSSFYAVSPQRNTRKLYLTGLSILMYDTDPAYTGMKSYLVKVRWDDYDVKQDVNWTGDIVLKEQLNLIQNKKITLQQSYTVNQIPKDPASNFFAKTTFFTCEENSVFNMAVNSAVSLKDKSFFVMNANSTMTLQNGAIITVESGTTLLIKSGANLNILGSGKIIVKSGGYICVESGANINLQDYTSLIILEEGANYGANPSLFSSPSCSGTITKTGSGAIADFNQDIFIQNTTINTSRYYGGKNIFIGNHVTTNQQTGDVLITNGANVIFNGKSITFDAGFECNIGSAYETINH